VQKLARAAGEALFRDDDSFSGDIRVRANALELFDNAPSFWRTKADQRGNIE
jgi:hypothetical protein